MIGPVALMAMVQAPTMATSAEAMDAKALAIIERTRTERGTYTIYWRVAGSGPGEAKRNYSWSATFRQGANVRAERASVRAVADCAVGKGNWFWVGIGNSQYENGPKIAQRLCGIDADRKIRAARYLGQQESRFGTVDRVEVTDQHGVSTYDVTADGVVVGMTVTYSGENYRTVAEVMEMIQGVPEGNLFSRVSLATSRVPKIVQGRGSRPER